MTAIGIAVMIKGVVSGRHTPRYRDKVHLLVALKLLGRVDICGIIAICQP